MTCIVCVRLLAIMPAPYDILFGRDCGIFNSRVKYYGIFSSGFILLMFVCPVFDLQNYFRRIVFLYK